MSFILRWLGFSRPAVKVGLRPHREVTLSLGYDAAYAAVRSAFDTVLGANVYLDDPGGRLIEGGFGLVNNERVRASFTPLDSAQTQTRIEALFPAGAHVPERSHAVEALAAALERLS